MCVPASCVIYVRLYTLCASREQARAIQRGIRAKFYEGWDAAVRFRKLGVRATLWHHRAHKLEHLSTTSWRHLCGFRFSQIARPRIKRTVRLFSLSVSKRNDASSPTVENNFSGAARYVFRTKRRTKELLRTIETAVFCYRRRWNSGKFHWVSLRRLPRPINRSYV